MKLKSRLVLFATKIAVYELKWCVTLQNIRFYQIGEAATHSCHISCSPARIDLFCNLWNIWNSPAHFALLTLGLTLWKFMIILLPLVANSAWSKKIEQLKKCRFIFSVSILLNFYKFRINFVRCSSQRNSYNPLFSHIFQPTLFKNLVVQKASLWRIRFIELLFLCFSSFWTQKYIMHSPIVCKAADIRALI